MIFSIPLAWLQLVRQRLRFIVALAGITFIVVLMFMQIGFQDALYSSAVQVHRSLRGDLFLISTQYQSLTSQQSFNRSRLYQVLGFDGVVAVSPVYVQFAKFKNPQNGQKFPIYVLGFDPAYPAFNLPEVEENLNILKIQDRVLFDQDSRPEFGAIAQKFNQGEDVTVEIFPFNDPVGYQAKVGGLFKLGPSFGVDGNLVVNYSMIFQIFRDREADRIDIGVISLHPNADPAVVIEKLKAFLPQDVRIFNRDDFITFEKNYWSLRTPIGFIFSLMVIMGFVVGVVVVYQILYSNISNHMIEYATLKAIGFKHKYLLGVVFQQALVLAVLGYIPGVIISFGLYDLATDATRLPIVMTANKILIVFISTMAMCFTSGFFSVTKLRSTDPASVF